MKMTNPLFTASAASVVYFFIFIMLKYSLENRILDMQNALEGALAGALFFWVFIFVVHYFLNRNKSLDRLK